MLPKLRLPPPAAAFVRAFAGAQLDAVRRMILEVAILTVRPGQEAAFERDFASASQYISSIEGYLSHELLRCHEQPNRYILLAKWATLEAHTEGFRKSPQYAEWKRMLHHYYDPLPTVEHYSTAYFSE